MRVQRRPDRCWWTRPGAPARCSAADIKWRAIDAKLVAVQRAILASATRCKTGGRLVATCNLLRKNEDVVAGFWPPIRLRHGPGRRGAGAGTCIDAGQRILRLLPHRHRTDGFSPPLNGAPEDSGHLVSSTCKHHRPAADRAVCRHPRATRQGRIRRFLCPSQSLIMSHRSATASTRAR